MVFKTLFSETISKRVNDSTKCAVIRLQVCQARMLLHRLFKHTDCSSDGARILNGTSSPYREACPVCYIVISARNVFSLIEKLHMSKNNKYQHGKG